MPRVLLILPTATYRAADFISAAQSLGIDLAIASEEPNVLAESLGERFVEIDCARPETAAESIVDLATRTPIDSIIAVDDAGVLPAAIASERLGLPHNRADAVAATRNKVMLRRRWETAEIPQPSFRLVGTTDDPVTAAEEIGFPLVVKPLSLSGSRGVLRVDDAKELRGAVERVRRIIGDSGGNPNEPVLIERFIPGVELAIEGLLRGGSLEVLAFLDKPDPLDGPTFEETMFVTPSRLHPEVLEEVEAVVERAVQAAGLSEGPIHAEVRVNGSNISMIEVAARSIGGLCGRALRFGLAGVSLESVLLRHAAGLPIRRASREKAASGVMMLPIPRSGVLVGVAGVTEAEAVTNVTEVEITVPLRSRIQTLPEGDRYMGFVFARADEPAQVEEALRQAADLIHFKID